MNKIRRVIRNGVGSWMTTTGFGIPGVAMVWAEIDKAIDGDPLTKMLIAPMLIGVCLIVGGFASRDGDKSSEAVGANES